MATICVNGVNVFAWMQWMSEAFACDCQVNMWMDKMSLLAFFCFGKTCEWRGHQWTICLWKEKSEWWPLTMCFLTVCSRPCLETSPHTILRIPFAGHCLGALWGGKPCPAELSEGVNRVLRTLSGDPPLPILQTPSAGHCLDTTWTKSRKLQRVRKYELSEIAETRVWNSWVSMNWHPQNLPLPLQFSPQHDAL